MMRGLFALQILFRTIAGNSSGPVALFVLTFFNCLIIPFTVQISRRGMLDPLPEWGIFRW